MAVTKVTLHQQAVGVFLAEATHGRRFLKDAKVIAAQIAEDDSPAPLHLCAIMGSAAPASWGELAAIVLAKE